MEHIDERHKVQVHAAGGGQASQMNKRPDVPHQQCDGADLGNLENLLNWLRIRERYPN